MRSDRVRRREFICLLGGAAAAWPIEARAQQPTRVPRIGIVDDSPMWQTFRQALHELGYVEGKTVNFEYRYGAGMPDRLAAVMILPFITDRAVIGETERELFRILRFFSSQVRSDWFGYIEFHWDYFVRFPSPSFAHPEQGRR